MKTRFACLFASLTLLICISTHVQGQDLSRISVKGNKFVTADGNPIVFRGLNTSDPNKLTKDGHWNKEYFQEMKNWGATIARFPVHPAAWRELGKENYIKLLDQGIGWAKEVGMYVIIDWHSIGNLRTEMYQADMYETTKKETFEFWRSMAKQYKDNTTVAFFELYNEPTTYNGQLGQCSWAEWRGLVEEMIGIIRAHGATTVPLVAGFNWAYDHLRARFLARSSQKKSTCPPNTSTAGRTS